LDGALVAFFRPDCPVMLSAHFHRPVRMRSTLV
jgi:hypothetical protein